VPDIHQRTHRRAIAFGSKKGLDPTPGRRKNRDNLVYDRRGATFDGRRTIMRTDPASSQGTAISNSRIVLIKKSVTSHYRDAF